MVARHAKNLRTTAKAKAKWASGNLGKLALACSKKIEWTRAQIVLLSKPLGPLARRDAQKKRAQSLAQKKVVLVGVLGRQARLLAKSKRLDALAKAGLASQVFGGGRLAGQASHAGTAGAAFKSKASWSKAWNQARRGMKHGGKRGYSKGTRRLAGQTQA